MIQKVVIKMIKTQQYRKRIIIQNYVESKNSRGITSKEWKDYKKVWANIKTGIAEEIENSNKINPQKLCEITIRYNSLLEKQLSNTEQYRILYKQPYNIKAIENVDEANIELKLKCEAIGI